MAPSWDTKFGRRRVKHEPPTIEEAFDAAQGLSGDPQEQIEIAASLIALPVEEVKARALKRALGPIDSARASRAAGKPVIVERKKARPRARQARGLPSRSS